MSLANAYKSVYAESTPDLYKRFAGAAGVSAPDESNPKSNLAKLTVEELLITLNTCYRMLQKPVKKIGDLKEEKALLVYGRAGIGKSAVMKQFAKSAASREKRQFIKFDSIPSFEARDDLIQNPEKYYVFLDVRAGDLNPDDVHGVPDIELGRKKGYSHSIIPAWVKLISRPEFSGLVLIDEINRSGHHIMNMMLQFVLDRVIGGYRCSDRCMLVAAANFGSEFEGSNLAQLDQAHTRRFAVGILVLDSKEWEWYARKEGVNKYMIDYAMSSPDKNLFGKGIEVANGDIPINPATLVFASRAMDHIESEYKDYMEKKDSGQQVDLKDFNISGNIMHDVRVALQVHLGHKYVNDFIQWLEIVHAFDWADIINKAKSGDFKAMNDKKSTVDTSKKYALMRYIIDKTLEFYNQAKKNGDQAAKTKIVNQLHDDLYHILGGIDGDTLSFILTGLSNHFRLSPPEGMSVLDAAKEWIELINPVFQRVHKNGPPEFLKKLQMVNAELKKVKNPEGQSPAV